MLRLLLSPAARDELVRLRDTAAKAYLRERAAALLKIADGIPAAQVARTGLLRPRQPDTVYRWVHRYQDEGIAGLDDRPGRGRKPAFSP
jgi:transposase